MNIPEIISRTTKEVDEWVREEMYEPIPTSMEDATDLTRGSEQMAEIINRCVYLAQIDGTLKWMIREAKRNGNKVFAEDLIDKKEIIDNALKILQLQRDTLSRMVTIKNIKNEELKALKYL